MSYLWLQISRTLPGGYAREVPLEIVSREKDGQQSAAHSRHAQIDRLHRVVVLDHGRPHLESADNVDNRASYDSQEEKHAKGRQRPYGRFTRSAGSGQTKKRDIKHHGRSNLDGEACDDDRNVIALRSYFFYESVFDE